jgi:YggT family protein
VATALYVVALVLRVYWFVLLGRVIIEMIRSFSRRWSPPRWFAVAAEPLFVLTDIAVKPLRRLIPPLRLGGVALDISVLVLFFGLSLLSTIVLSVASGVG